MTAPFCSPECKANNGWRLDPDTLLPADRCPCRHRELTPQQARDHGQAATVEANPDAMRAALAIIRDAAKSRERLSANTVRDAMRIAQVPGPVVGAAFRQACRDRVLMADDYEPSTEPGTHAHPVRTYISRLHRRTA